MMGSFRRIGGLMACLAAASVPFACSQAGHPSQTGGRQPSPAILADSNLPRPAAELLLQTEPWTLDAAAGKILHTPQYRLYTTSTKAFLLDNLPAFVETAASHYRSSLGTLPAPRGSMEIYLLDTRPQWEQMTQRFMGDQADTYLRIQRGGFSYDGRAILYDIGRRDTFTITAHEGWHVYTQSTFKNSLPVWMEEGLATYMEGFRWDPNAADRPTFLPWANFERFDQLRWAVRGEKLMSLDLLTRSTPQELIARDSNAALHYYAQVWALMHFLNEGEQGAYRDALRAMVSDAATGQLVPRIRRELGDRAASSYSYRRRGADLIKLYTGKTAAELDPQYAAFMQQIVKTGTRTNIWQGQSPLAPAAAPQPPQ